MDFDYEIQAQRRTQANKTQRPLAGTTGVTGNLITHEGARSQGDISRKFRRVRLVRKDSSREGVICFVLEEQLLAQFTAEFMHLPSFSQKSL